MPVCLNMIVRDEAAVIERCLRSVRPFIDRWVIVDTGSVDDTPDRVRRCLADIPGELHHRPWRNFGHNRSEAMQLAKTALRDQGYLLFIDADEQLAHDDRFTGWPALTEPAYSLEARFGGISYDRVSLVSATRPWRWVGVLHEYLDCGEPVAQPRVPGIWITVTPDGARSADPHKYAKDAEVLQQALREEPDNARYVFYLAQSWRDAGRPDLAAIQYARRAEMGGWDEEVWYAKFQCAQLAEHLGRSYEEVLAAYLHTHQFRPSRAESLCRLATYLRGRQEWHLAYLFAQQAAKTPLSQDRLFVDLATYHWRSTDEWALAAHYTGRYEEAHALWSGLLSAPLLPVSERQRIQANLAFADTALRQRS
jgi:glycosyltransferase involved in cell wall biosynthesis